MKNVSNDTVIPIGITEALKSESPATNKWYEDSAETFNRDDNFDFTKSDWAKSILGTVYTEIEYLQSQSPYS